MRNLYKYAVDWYQPIYAKKAEIVVYYTSVQCPKLGILLDHAPLTQRNNFKYLGFHLDAQLVKTRRSFIIMKYIHKHFAAQFQLRSRFFNAYIWPHMNMLSTIFCICSQSLRNELSAFYRRCLRLINCLYRCPSTNLQDTYGLPALEDRLRKTLRRRLAAITNFWSLSTTNTTVGSEPSRTYQEENPTEV